MEGWVTVARAGSMLEAEIWKGLLESQGIPVYLVAKGLSGIGSILLGHHAVVPGGVELRVPPGAAGEARELLRAEPAAGEVASEEPGGDAADGATGEPDGDAADGATGEPGGDAADGATGEPDGDAADSAAGADGKPATEPGRG